MRYIKPYKLFESIVDIELTIYDILLDMTDDGFEIEDTKIGIDDDSISLTLSIPIFETGPDFRSSKTFVLSNEIVEVIERCCEYTNSVGYQCRMSIDIVDHIYKFDIANIRDYINREVYFIGINIKKKKI